MKRPSKGKTRTLLLLQHEAVLRLHSERCSTSSLKADGGTRKGTVEDDKGPS